MSRIPRSVRRAVAARAGHRCEYCLLPSYGQAGSFEIDHIVPRSAGGTSDLFNLALACPFCNAHKWAFTLGPSEGLPKTVRLFNPRNERWADHFCWSSRRSFEIEGLTETGRATIARLQMNHFQLINARVAMARAGILVLDR